MQAMDFLEIVEREVKPRKTGLTLCHDPGHGVKMLDSLLDGIGQFVDYIKSRNLTPRMWSDTVLREKIAVMKRYQVKSLPGGMYGELAYLQGKWDRAAEYMAEVGYEAFELSENYVDFPPEEKARMIKKLVTLGIEVLYEWGRKTPERPLDPAVTADAMRHALDQGASKVILEENEVDAILGPDGLSPEAYRLDKLIEKIGMDVLIVESTQTAQQHWLLKNYGATINLGANIRLEGVALLEAHRRGLGLKVDWFAIDPWMKRSGLVK